MFELRRGVLAVALVGAAALGLATSASAQRPFSWTGFYVGGNAGYAWGDADYALSVKSPPPGFFPIMVPASIPVVNAAGTGGLNDSNGFTGGGQIGYNQQIGHLVLGVEVDAQSLDVRSANRVDGVTPGGTVFTTVSALESNYLLTARARVGLALPSFIGSCGQGCDNRTLLYVTGGFASSDAHVQQYQNWNTGGFQVLQNYGDRSNGWVVGGGVEFALSGCSSCGGNWTVKAEYLRVDLGDQSTQNLLVQRGPAGPTQNSMLMTLNSSTDLNIARIGINYKFGPRDTAPLK